MGCYHCSGHWWTSKGWSDHHIREHPHSDPYPSGAALERLLVKKAQAQTLAESEDVSSASRLDDPVGDEIQSSISSGDSEEEDPIPSFPSSSLGSVSMVPSSTEVAKSSPGNYGGAHPHILAAVVGSGRHKKALPHHSNRA